MSRHAMPRPHKRPPAARVVPRAAYAALALAPTLGGCGGGEGDGAAQTATPQTQRTQPAEPPTPPPAVPRFVDATGPSNINHQFGFAPRDLSVLEGVELNLALQVDELTAGGAAAGDYDGDGDIDVLITRGDRGPNLLYRNLGGLTFVETAFAAGLANTKSANENYAHSGPTFADMDGDGHLDLFLGGLWDDPSKIFRNDGSGVFTDVTNGSGIDALRARNNISAAFGDYDRDGDLDLFVSHWGTPRDLDAPGDTQNLWENVSTPGKIAFRSVSVEARISPSIISLPDPHIAVGGSAEYTFTPTFARIDADLFPDLASVADFNRTMLFMNNTDGTFRNATDTDVLIDDNGMGSALGDYDNDGDLDWFVSSIFSERVLAAPLVTPVGNRLYRNDGAGRFTDVSAEALVYDGGWGWGACFLDFENDGDLDIYHTNGWLRENPWGNHIRDRSRAFVQTAPGRFTEAAAELGLEDDEQGRGVVCADFDDDGDTDILLIHMGPPTAATLWENTTSGASYLRVRLRGLAPNTEAVGTRVYARVGATEQMREIRVGSNFISQNPTNVVIFGLGTAGVVDELRFEWPDGTTSTHLGVAANQTFEAGQPGASP